MLIIDPTNIPAVYHSIVHAFFQQTELSYISQDTEVHIEGIGEVVFSQSLLRCTNLYSERELGSISLIGLTKQFEVFDAKVIYDKGGQAQIYSSRGVLSVYHHELHFTVGSERLIKVGKSQSVSRVEKQLHLTGLNLCCNAPVEVGEYTYLIMNKLHGNLLSEEMKKPRSIPFRFLLALEIIDAIKTVHNKGIIHRDITPNNIIVHARTLTASLIDFGIAEFLTSFPVDNNDLGSDLSFQGTFGYAAPEEYNDLPLSTATDVYSTAVLIAQLFGAIMKPRKGGVGFLAQAMRYSENIVFYNTLRSSDLPHECARSLEAVLTKMSVVNPESRLTLAEAESAIREIWVNYEAGLYHHPFTVSMKPKLTTNELSGWLIERGKTPRARCPAMKTAQSNDSVDTGFIYVSLPGFAKNEAFGSSKVSETSQDSLPDLTLTDAHVQPVHAHRLFTPVDDPLHPQPTVSFIQVELPTLKQEGIS